MNSQTVSSLLQNSFDPDVTKRSVAEDQLSQLGKTPGFIQVLLQIVMDQQIPFPIKQSASLLLKNTIVGNWGKEVDNNPEHIIEGDRQQLRAVILQAIIAQGDNRLRVQLLEVFYPVVRKDFPEKWPHLIDEIMANVRAHIFQESNRVYGGLSALKMVFKRYQYHSSVETLSQLTNAVMPQLIQILEIIMPSFQSSEASQEMTRVIVKIYWMSTQDELSPLLQEPQMFSRWMQVFLFILKSQASREASDADESGECLISKAQKTVASIMVRYIDRFASPVVEEYASFRQMFIGPYAESILEVFLSIIQAKSKGSFIATQTLRMGFEFIRHAVDSAHLYSKMKPHLSLILFHGIFEVFCMTKEDLELWTSDPEEYIYQSSNLYEDYFDPRVTATDLLVQFVRVRTRDTLEAVMTSVHQIVQNAQSPPEDINKMIQKDAALKMLGSLSELLTDHPQVSAFAEKIIVSSVISDFQCNFGVLKARACWMAGKFSNMSFSNPQIAKALMEGVIRCLSDPQFPVQMDAAVAISQLLERKDIIEIVRPYLQHLLTALFGLVGKAGSEITIDALESVITAFGKDIAPFAYDLCKHLFDIYRNFVATGNEEDEEGFCAALHAIRTINTVLYSVLEVPNIYPTLEPITYAIIEGGLNEANFTIIEDIMDMLVTITYHSTSISPQLWHLYDLCISALDTFAMDYLSNAVPVIDNYVSRDTQGFLSNDRLSKTLSVCEKAMKSDDAFMGLRNACKILECIVLTCKGSINHMYPQILRLAVEQLSLIHPSEEIGQTTKIGLVDLISALIYYNSKSFIDLLVQWKCCESAFQCWISYSAKLKAAHAKSMSIALSSLASVPPASLPDFIGANFNQIVSTNVMVLDQLKASSEKNESELRLAVEDSLEDENSSKFLDIPETQDFVNKDEFGFIHQLEHFLEEDYDYDEEYDEEDEDAESPLDNVNAFSYFSQSLQYLAGNQSQFYSNTLSRLTPPIRELLQSHLNWASHVENLNTLKDARK